MASFTINAATRLSSRRTLPTFQSHISPRQCLQHQHRRLQPQQPHTTTRQYGTSDSLPKIAQPSLWNSLVPKFIRNRKSRSDSSSPKSKEWNPASFYIIMFTLIGSQAIRMIALKNDYAAFTRSTDAKITLLREVIERVKNGEKVDVEKLLGTGNEAKEREWDEVLQEIEAEESLWHQKNAAAAKEPAPAAEPPKTSDEPSTENASKRKAHFF
ncbi:hypothetical protein P168DRAFT_267985 [Aspergillus campestris IBT 28561]|uniref:Uncharacterized protein n=1 Tax=Aspergillus campestris (strain IBT 28561) TaxID=1392248 RepID=A0A2I1D5B4_ASPC2|nr:uncharacterized protein P168DRAFT_267985 [Aspergillus campestris IBT 28561]PKY05060.1 hypothetical protein P168DRAFT_267985 [Aspergillus campestris IBT 28561]